MVFIKPIDHFATNKYTSLYIHIPFCETICHYCNFCKKPYDANQAKLTLAAIHAELKYYADTYPDLIIRSIYIGGGTPTAIEPTYLIKLMDYVKKSWDWVPNCEITLEMNPRHVNSNWCDASQSMGITRISLGAQSSHAPTLDRLGRDHIWDNVAHATEKIRNSLPCVSLNLDLIYGIKGLTRYSLAHVIQDYCALEPDHITVYGLIIEPGTPFYRQQDQSLMRLDADMAIDYTCIDASLTAAGFTGYDIAAFAKRQALSHHNCGYWHFYPYIGIGPGAHSFFRGHRFRHPSSLIDYSNQPVHASLSQLCRPLKLAHRFEEWVMLGLRTQFGLDYTTDWFGAHCLIPKNYEKLLHDNFLSVNNTTLTATKKGARVLDSVVHALLNTSFTK